MTDQTNEGRRTLSEFVQQGSDVYANQDYPFDESARIDAARVRQALAQLGFEVTVTTAAAVWEEYSAAYQAGWLDVPDRVEDVQDILVIFSEARCRGEI